MKPCAAALLVLLASCFRADRPDERGLVVQVGGMQRGSGGKT